MSIERLKELQLMNNIKGLEMCVEASQSFKKIADRHNNGTAPRAITAFNLFQTPEKVADMMVKKINPFLKDGAKILEPSAGLGRLYKAVYRRIGDSMYYTLVEKNTQCMAELYKMDIPGNLRQGDFLEMDFDTKFNMIIMNPPFKMGRDIKHINHAKQFLKPGGILISLCYNGVKQNEMLKPICNTWKVLPDNSFKAEGTSASVVMLTILAE